MEDMTPFEQVTVRQVDSGLHVQVLIVLGTFLLAALALWGDKLRSWLFQPWLKISVRLQAPYCQRFDVGDCFRVEVTNKSMVTAKDVEVWITEIYRHPAMVRMPLPPIPLVWTHTMMTTTPSINPHFQRFFDFGVFGGGQFQKRFELSTNPKPTSDSQRLGPGTYLVTLAITASNAKPRYFKLKFNVPNYFPPTEEEALKAVDLQLFTVVK